MLTAMVAGYYEPNGNEIYPPGSDAYGEYCYGVQDMCNHMPCTFHGPPGVRMVSNSSPVPMPLQVPPGHLVQQVVDENGTVRHFLLSPPMALPVGAHYSPSHASTTAPMATPPYYPYPQPTYAAPPHFQPQPPSHLQPSLNPQNMMMHLSQCNGQSLHGICEDASPPPIQLVFTQKEEPFQRQTYKFRRKVEGRSKDNILHLPNQPGSIVKRDQRRSRHEDMRINGSSASGSNASEDEEVTWMFTEYLSNMRPPVVSELSSNSVLVCWKPPEIPNVEMDTALLTSMQQSDILYEVTICEKKKEGRFKIIYSGMDHYCNITSLKPSTEYYVCVQASLDDIRGSTIKGQTFKTPSAEPEAPPPPKLYGRTKNSLTLKWNTTIDSTKIKSYILEFDEGCNRNNFVPVYTGPLKSFKINKLVPATGYKFRLAAVNEKGKSPYSETCCFYTSGQAPSQPVAPRLLQACANRLHLEWEKRDSDRDFSLQIEEDRQRQGFLLAYNGKETNFVCCGLKGNTEYRFRLCASNAEGSSPWSRLVTFSTLEEKLCCPGKPVAKGRIHASCFRVAWDPPKDYKQSSITKYVLEVDRGFGFYSAYTGPDTEFFLENLLPGTLYKVKVACITSTGHRQYSEVNSITTAAVCPGKCPPPVLRSKPEAARLRLDWEPPEHDGGDAVSEYEVSQTGTDNLTLTAYRGPNTSCLADGLLPGRFYLFQVRACNRVGPGPWSEPLQVVSGAGPPDAPRNLQASSGAPSSCLVSWEEPLNNGAAITSYRLLCSPKDEDDSYTELYEGSSLSYEATELKPATVYYFKVKAVNEAGTGAASASASCATPPSVPGLVSKVRWQARTRSLSVLWTVPAAHGSPIRSYNVEMEGELYNNASDVPELCIEELEPQTDYRLRVQAVNEVGEGPFSPMVTASTLRSPPDPPDLECAVAGPHFLRLRWGKDCSPDATGYTLEMSSRSKSFTSVYHGPGLGHKVHKLHENTTYHFRICAASASGQGVYSPVYTFLTSRAPPSTPKAPRATTVCESSCEVEWVAAKRLPGDALTYRVQMSCGSDRLPVYEGPQTSCTIDNLRPNTRYSFRVATARHCDGAKQLGAYGPALVITTAAKEKATTPLADPALPATARAGAAAHDRTVSAALVAAHTLASFLLAAILERAFGLCS